MSFILDALKKSESERLRRDTPGFADVPDRTRDRPAKRWTWIIITLIAVNIGVLATLLLKRERAPDTVSAAQVDMPAAASEAVDAPQALVVPPDVEEATTAGQAATTPPPVVPAAIDPPARRSEAAAPAVDYRAPSVAGASATFDELRAQGVLNLPDLHLDIHVHAPLSEDRFVFVNMRKYKERARLDEGPVVREITPDGVILEYRGKPFLLPRE